MRNQTPILGEKYEIQRTLDTAYMERAENIPLDEQKVVFVVKPQLQKEYITVTSCQILLLSSFPTLTFPTQRWSGLQFMWTQGQFSTDIKTIQSKLQKQGFLFYFVLFCFTVFDKNVV